MNDWIIIGISGVTCSGKTSLSNEIHGELPNSVIISQDDYFHPIDSPLHTFNPKLNCINLDIISCLDMKRMHDDVLKVINGSNQTSENGTASKDESSTKRILIVEGFILFNYKPISDLCNLKYFFTIDKEVCWERRQLRNYDPPDVPGYFEEIVWPEYEKYKSEIINDKSLSEGLKFIDGSGSKKCIFDQVYGEIKKLMFQ